VITLPYLALLSRARTMRSERLTRFVETLQRGSHLTSVYESPTMLILASSQLPGIILPDGNGMILGYLFDRQSGTRVARDPGTPLDEPAERFVERYWGGYLALRTRHATAEILRDPSGAMPCYHVAMDDMHVFTSQPALLFHYGLAQPEIDWTILTQGLVFQDLKPARTALRGVSELLPGMSAKSLPPGLALQCVWNPWRFTHRTMEARDFAIATASVREAAVTCIGAWGQCFDRPSVELSGGLDSSIVAAGLARINPLASAMTYAALEGDPDETPYARAVADRLGMKLDVAAPDIASIDIGVSEARDLPRPVARCFSQGYDRIAHDHARAIRADAFFSGGGGDNVFSYQRSLAPVRDRLIREGLSPGVIATIGDIAALGDTSIWHVVLRTLRRSLRREPMPAWRADHALLSSDAIAALPLPQGNPWLEAPPASLPGKRAHVAALMEVQNHLEGHGRLAFAPIISPLLSQPVMEACLAVPSWLWCTGGRNRAVARAAFADALPETVIARQSKGAFDGLAARLVAANRDHLRALLLEGCLAAQGLLDLDAVAAALDTATLESRTIVRLLTLADVEAWARAWRIRLDDPRSAP